MALTLHNRTKYPYFFLIIIAAVIVAWLRFARKQPPELLVSVLVGVAGVAYFMYRQHLDETKLFKELFTEFNGRYDALNDDLNTIVSGAPEVPLSTAEKERLFSYFNLCAEEYFFYTAGYIDRRVWEAWCKGMEIFFDHPRVHILWKQECEADSYYGFRPPSKQSAPGLAAR